MKWNEIDNGYKFSDKSVVVQVHPRHYANTIKIGYLDFKTRESYRICVSEDHLFEINLTNISKDERLFLYNSFKDIRIPIQEDLSIEIIEGTLNRRFERDINHYFKNNVFPSTWKNIKIINSYINESNKRVEVIAIETELSAWIVKVTYITVKDEPKAINKKKIWLSAKEIKEIIDKDFRLLMCNNNVITTCIDGGKREVFCVSTDTGRYELNGLIHHNSVTIRNIIFHAIQHENEINVALVDIKQTEFTQFKGVKGVLAVANSVEEAAEIIRIARKIMYKRNIEMAELGITDIKDHKPKDYTGKIWVTGREMDENDTLIAVIDGQEKEITAIQLMEMLES